MTVKEFIKELLDNVENLNSDMDFYVYADTEYCKRIVDNDECIDDFRGLKRINEQGGIVHIELEELEY